MLSPWVDLRVPPKEVKLRRSRRKRTGASSKTHLPVDALVYSPKAKYIYVGRDGRDVMWSMHNHHVMANDHWYRAINDTPGRVGPPVPKADPDVRRYFPQLARGQWRAVLAVLGKRPKLVGDPRFAEPPSRPFREFEARPSGEMAKIANFLEIDLDEKQMEQAATHCTFGWMKENAAKSAPLGGAIWEGGAQTFIHKGTNGRWRDVLTAEDNRRYEAMALEKLGPDCAHWLKTGERG